MTSETQIPRPEGPAIPDTLPVLPLRGTVAFPLAVMPLVVGRERSVGLVDDVMRGERLVALVAQTRQEHEDAGPEDLHRVGTAAVIHQLMRAPDGSLRLMVQGLERIKVLEFTSTEPYLVARIEPMPDERVDGIELEGLQRALVDLFRRLVALVDELPDELGAVAESLADPVQAVYLVASTIPMEPATRQEILALDPLDAKMRRLVDVLQHVLAVRELGHKITAETHQQMNKAQKDYFLREQLKAIQRELGEEDPAQAAVADLRTKLELAQPPQEARREAERELERLAAIPPASPEHGIIRSYLEWMVNLPWNTLAGGEIDVARAGQVLDEDHYDLEKIKERIIEYLAVKKLRRDRVQRANERPPEVVDGGVPLPLAPTPQDLAAREPILCFVGPPGVGKTSLGQSIARALGRKFVRMSLGGVHDEAEIRGHRRTYIGAMPGRAIQGIRRTESRDPVFMLDEIDKVGADWRGDPSSALLEVLDPAQNHSFMDNYLGVPFDLSQVLFITTANTTDTIQPALRDRMEVLELSGYTEDEKLNIAKGFLIPKQLTAHGLAVTELLFEDEALRQIIRGYTREAGVRNLEREIANVCRKVARRVAEGLAEPTRLTAELVDAYLGRPRHFDEVSERTDRPGVATGMAWTPSGGDVLFIEATMMPSTDERLILTGMLGDVMRESAQAALSYVRSNAERLDIDPRLFERKAVHVHVPAGAIPKDGPSAGVTMATALASLACGRMVRGDTAMTGEVTLRGKVLPVGGIKEKVLAAHRAGVKRVILPRRNERDLDDVPTELRQHLEFIFVDTVNQVLEQALEPRAAPDERGREVGMIADNARRTPDTGRRTAGQAARPATG